jgi:hypothetical protein
MGRPSKLTPDQWAEIERKLNEGESASALAREYGISQPVISNRFSKVSNNIKSVAAIIAKGQDELAALPVVQQYQALSLAEKMRSISANLACAAENGSKTAKTLSSIASKQAEMVDPMNPMESHESLQAISALTKISNDAAQLGMGLININKAAQFNGAEDETTPGRIEVVVRDARRDNAPGVR